MSTRSLTKLYTSVLSLSSHDVVLIAATSLCLFVASVAVYRLYFSPLASIPGPKLAALTSLYGLYHDLGRGGQYVWVVEEMHRQYGPIVRIRPETIHMKDPLFIETLYSGSGNRRMKYKTTTNSLLAKGSMLATKDHNLHRHRRATLNTLFSKKSVRNFEPTLRDTVRKLLQRMEDWGKSKTPAPMTLAFKAATKDIVSNYCFGADYSNSLDRDDLEIAYFRSLPSGATGVFFAAYFPWIAESMLLFPPALIAYMNPSLMVFMKFVEGLTTRVAHVKDQIKTDNVPQSDYITIMHNIFSSDMPESEKAVPRVTEEAYVILVAGTDTTAGTMGVICYHLLTMPCILKKVKEELATVIPDADKLPTCADLVNLPYMTAVVNEALRLYPATMLRQDRIAPDEALVYTSPNGKSYTIPANTPVGMTAYGVNRSPIVYDKPNEFRPERYIEDPTLIKYLLSFSKGTRQCLGINLAYEELLLFTAGIFRKYDAFDGTGTQKGPSLELYETTIDDIRYVADQTTPVLKPGSKGVRIMVRNGEMRHNE